LGYESKQRIIHSYTTSELGSMQ